MFSIPISRFYKWGMDGTGTNSPSFIFCIFSSLSCLVFRNMPFIHLQNVNARKETPMYTCFTHLCASKKRIFNCNCIRNYVHDINSRPKFDCAWRRGTILTRSISTSVLDVGFEGDMNVFVSGNHLRKHSVKLATSQKSTIIGYLYRHVDTKT